MPAYNKGVIDSDAGLTGFLHQTRSTSIECDLATATDHNGNVCAVKFFNHRAKVKLDAVLPDSAGVPVPGSVLSIEGITLPSVSAAGVISGTYKIDPSVTIGVKFAVIGSPSAAETNNDYRKCSIEAQRHIVLGIPA